jgi:predicted TIM-barrel fold metal-dependent hydrolase
MHVGSLGEIVPAPEGEIFLSPAEIAADQALRREVMARVGVARGVVLPILPYRRPDGLASTRRVNDGVAAYRDADSAHFPVGLGMLEPLYGERGLEELDRIHFELKLPGVTWHHRLQGGAIDDPLMFRIFERMRAYGMIPFVHTHYQALEEAPWRLVRLAQAFPDLPVVALDAFSSPQQIQEVFFLAGQAPNLYFDTALVAGQVGAVAGRFVEAFGAERLLYGSNLYPAPMHHMRSPVLDELRAAPLTPADRALVLGGNIRRLFDL